MYLYLGGDTVIKAKDITGIFDMDTSTVNKATRDYLSNAEKNKKLIYVNYELPKSFVVCNDKIYVCPFNTATLLKRSK
ncbi:MAG: extracellular matrix regulator RemB [Eubacterium sp.]